MSGGFGTGAHGFEPFGGLLSPFVVDTITPIDYRTVELHFSNDYSDTSVITAPGSYAIDRGLNVIAVQIIDSQTIRLFTTDQVQGVTYTVTFPGLIVDDDDQPLSTSSISFIGLGLTPQYLVSGFDARTECEGLAVYLSWTNPAAAAHVKIVRRLRAWPFDLTDAFDTVYDGPAITSFKDTGNVEPLTTLGTSVAVGAVSAAVTSTTGYSVGDQVRIENLTGPKTFDLVTVSAIGGGALTFATTPLANAYPSGARVSKSVQLQPQTYYYYLVLVSTSSSPTSYDIGDASRAFALSIDVLNSKDWLWQETPVNDKSLDATDVSLGGGGGFLDKWFTVMGCWLNRMRGELNAIETIGDPDKAPFNALPALNNALGIDAEGLSYDFDVVRRPLTSLVFVYQQKGTCPAIVEAVRMFTHWDATCNDFGTNECQGGASGLRTWDGISVLVRGSGTTTITQTVIDPSGTAYFVDTGATFVDGLYLSGTLRGALGDVACVNTNDEGDRLILNAPRQITTIHTSSSIGDTSFVVEDTSLIQPGMTIQLISITEVSSAYPSEIVEVLAVTSPGAPGTISTKGLGAKHAYANGSAVTLGKSIIRAEYTGTLAASTDAQATWTQNQWAGFKVLDSSNVLHNVLSNTGNTLTADGAALAAGPYAIATNFTVGGSFSARVSQVSYALHNGVQSSLFDPTDDLAFTGTIYDVRNRLYDGASSLAGIFGPSDIGIYILGSIPLIKGAAAGALGATFTLDPTQAPPSVGALVGNFLNPNQNQEQMFEILANTATTVTVAGDVSSLIVPGQFYYVLKPRDATRFQRVSHRLRAEFVDTDVKPHVLFV